MTDDDGVVRTWDEDQALLRATQDATAMFRKERDEALRLAGLLYNALLANHEAWETTNASNGAIRVARRATEDGIKYFERERGEG